MLDLEKLLSEDRVLTRRYFVARASYDLLFSSALLFRLMMIMMMKNRVSTGRCFVARACCDLLFLSALSFLLTMTMTIRMMTTVKTYADSPPASMGL